MTKTVSDALTEAQAALDPCHALRLELASSTQTIQQLHTAVKTAQELAATRLQEIERLREFVTTISKQKPEKPDYWSSCGQCERNASDAEDLLERPAVEPSARMCACNPNYCAYTGRFAFEIPPGIICKRCPAENRAPESTAKRHWPACLTHKGGECSCNYSVSQQLLVVVCAECGMRNWADSEKCGLCDRLLNGPLVRATEAELDHRQRKSKSKV